MTVFLLQSGLNADKGISEKCFPLRQIVCHVKSNQELLGMIIRVQILHKVRHWENKIGHVFQRKYYTEKAKTTKAYQVSQPDLHL